MGHIKYYRGLSYIRDYIGLFYNRDYMGVFYIREYMGNVKSQNSRDFYISETS